MVAMMPWSMSFLRIMLTLMPVCSQKCLMLIGTVISIFRSLMGVTTGRGFGGWTVGRIAGGGTRGFGRR